MYKYIVTYKIFKKELQETITMDEAIEDNEILEEIITDKLTELLSDYCEEYDFYIIEIEPMEHHYTTKELNNCTYDNIFK